MKKLLPLLLLFTACTSKYTASPLEPLPIETAATPTIQIRPLSLPESQKYLGANLLAYNPTLVQIHNPTNLTYHIKTTPVTPLKKILTKVTKSPRARSSAIAAPGFAASTLLAIALYPAATIVSFFSGGALTLPAFITASALTATPGLVSSAIGNSLESSTKTYNDQLTFDYTQKHLPETLPPKTTLHGLLFPKEPLHITLDRN